MVFLDRESCSEAEQVLRPGGKMQIRQGEDIPLDKEHFFLNLVSIFSSLCFSSICCSCSTSILMLVLSNYQIALLLDWYKLTPEKRKSELLIKFTSVSEAKRIFPNKSNVGKLDIYLKFSVRYSISIHADLLIVDIIMINTIIDKAPRFSIRRVIWILASDTEYQYLSNSINIHKYWYGNAV